jgi:hypothetical protein
MAAARPRLAESGQLHRVYTARIEHLAMARSLLSQGDV